MILSLPPGAAEYEKAGLFRRGDRAASRTIDGFVVEVDQFFDEATD